MGIPEKETEKLISSIDLEKQDVLTLAPQLSEEQAAMFQKLNLKPVIIKKILKGNTGIRKFFRISSVMSVRQRKKILTVIFL